jgi:hypothetical protein
MKLVCLDFDECLYSRNIQDINPPLDLSNKFHSCPYCYKLAVIIPNDFDFELTNEELFYIYYKITNSIKNDKDL